MDQKQETVDFSNLTEEEEQKIGEYLVKLFQMKEEKQSKFPGKPKSYNPCRYVTNWGGKTALGVARCVQGVFLKKGDLPE